MLSITELQNPLTADLDVSVQPGSALPLIGLLREADAQIFAGFQYAPENADSAENANLFPDGFPALTDAETVRAIDTAASAIGRAIKEASSSSTEKQTGTDIVEYPVDRVLVTVSGAGTSGRLAFLACRAFGHVVRQLPIVPQQRSVQEQEHEQEEKPQKTEDGRNLSSVVQFKYLTAGGDAALLRAREKTEDDVDLARDDLRRAIEDAAVGCTGVLHVCYIGVTCGLSAPYVASQLSELHHAASLSTAGVLGVQHARVASVMLLGFSPLSLARDAPIESWDRTFADVVRTCFQSKNALKGTRSTFTAVVPVVGPEALTGSTRMKGGSATKILLEVVLLRALMQSEHAVPVLPVRTMLLAFEETYRCVYDSTTSDLDGWSDVIVSAGATLSQAGRIMYFSDVPTYGIIGFIDASECPPTFGASGYDVRGFVGDGWSTLENAEGDLSNNGELYSLSLATGIDFLEQSQRTSGRQTVVVLSAGASAEETALTERLLAVRSGSTDLFILRVGPNADGSVSSGSNIPVISLKLPIGLSLHSCLQSALPEFALKLVLNAISLGAHVARGKVFNNVMADLGVSNNKLFFRAIRIVAQFANVEEFVARECVLRALHNVDGDVLVQNALPISAHIDQAAKVGSVVPVALLLASRRCMTVASARAELLREPVVRKLLTE